MSLSPLRRLIIPLVFIIIALFVRDMVYMVPEPYIPLLNTLPYLMPVVAMLLCMYYNRARTFTAALACLLVYYLIQSELQHAIVDIRPWFVYTAISVFLPLVFLLLFFLPERGLRNRYGLFTVMLLPLALVAGMALFTSMPGDELVDVMNRYFPVRFHPKYFLSIYASGGFIVVTLAGIIKLFRDRSEATAALLAVLILVWITLGGFYLEKISLVMFTTAGLVLIVSILQSAHAMAYRDELTGLLGRRALNEKMKGLGKRYVIAMLDIDHFKSFNDTYGHDVGDDVLKMVARQVDSVRGGGKAYRYGGEEFCIVFTGKTIEECKPYLELLRKQVEAYKMILRNKENRPVSEQGARERRGRRKKARDEKAVSVTVSIGVATPGDKNNSPDAVIKAADNALYKAKKKGRNCLVSV